MTNQKPIELSAAAIELDRQQRQGVGVFDPRFIAQDEAEALWEAK